MSVIICYLSLQAITTEYKQNDKFLQLVKAMDADKVEICYEILVQDGQREQAERMGMLHHIMVNKFVQYSHTYNLIFSRIFFLGATKTYNKKLTRPPGNQFTMNVVKGNQSPKMTLIICKVYLSNKETIISSINYKNML